MKKCSVTTKCNNPNWECYKITEFVRKYHCINCGGEKTEFINLYSGYNN